MTEGILKRRIESLISYHERRVQSIDDQMEHMERWGQGPYQRHDKALRQEFIRELREILPKEEKA